MMISRIAENTKFSAMSGSISQLQDGMSRASDQLSTLKRINKPSDDPEGAMNVMKLRTAGSTIDQYKGNIVAGETWLKTTSLALSSIDALLQQAQGVAQSRGSTVADRALAADTLENIAEQMLSFANMQLGGRYMFAGSNTETMPFPDIAFDYQGDGQSLQINIGQDAVTDYNITGDAVFSYNLADGSKDNIFQRLDLLVTALRLPYHDAAEIAAAGTVTAATLTAQNAATDAEIGTALDDLEYAASRVHEQVQYNITKTTAMSSNLKFADNHLTYLKNKIESMISKQEDADTAQLAMDLQMQALALNATYSVASKIAEVSVLNFLQ